MKKILGTETEFGISEKNSNTLDPVSHSILLINSYPYLPAPSAHWDYENENPLMDARGFEADGERELPGPEYNRLLNKLLANGGRLYVDGAHPEYSTPECSSPRDLVTYEKAGERIVETCLEVTNRLKYHEGQFAIYKNNTDNKGNSYGYHENYLVARALPFGKIVAQMTPFLVTRQIYAGSGKVGAENKTDAAAYQISQRADFFEVWVDLNTMVKRPIINTRDEPHADVGRYRRLHVIVGDSNMSEVTTYLKVGTTLLVLAMIEEGREVSGVDLENPVLGIKEVSRDLSMKKTIRLANGAGWTATAIQRTYLDAAETHFSRSDDPSIADILKKWRVVLEKLEEDPMQLSREIDWVIKKKLIESYMERKGCGWKDPRVAMMDIQYHDVVQKKGLYYALERGGHVDRLATPEAVADAQENPPRDTRAYFRGRCLKKFPKEVYAASWSSMLFDVGNARVKRLPLLDPFKGSCELVGSILDKVQTVDELIAMITA